MTTDPFAVAEAGMDKVAAMAMEAGMGKVVILQAITYRPAEISTSVAIGWTPSAKREMAGGNPHRSIM
jgi:hypothetical protein